MSLQRTIRSARRRQSRHATGASPGRKSNHCSSSHLPFAGHLRLGSVGAKLGTLYVDAVLTRRLLHMMESCMPALAMSLFGQERELTEMLLSYSPGEPAVNVYYPGGGFSPHTDKQARRTAPHGDLETWTCACACTCTCTCDVPVWRHICPVVVRRSRCSYHSRRATRTAVAAPRFGAEAICGQTGANAPLNTPLNNPPRCPRHEHGFIERRAARRQGRPEPYRGRAFRD